MNQQLGSLELNSHLISNWLGTSLSAVTSVSIPTVPSSVGTSDLFSGLNGSLSKSQQVPESTAPVTSGNPFLPSTPSLTQSLTTSSTPSLTTSSTNGMFNDTASFPSFPGDRPQQMAPSSLPPNQSEFNWANFNQPIPTGGPSSVPPASVLPSSDLWQ